MSYDSGSSSPLSDVPSNLSEAGNPLAEDGFKGETVLLAEPAWNLKQKHSHVHSPPTKNQSSPPIKPIAGPSIANKDSRVLLARSQATMDSEQDDVVENDSDFNSLAAYAPPLEFKSHRTPGPSSYSEIFHDDVGIDGLSLIKNSHPEGTNGSESSRKRRKSNTTTITEDPPTEMDKKRKDSLSSEQKNQPTSSPSLEDLRVNSRPTRNRKVPSRLIDMSPQTPPAKKSARASRASARNRTNWDPEYLVTNPKSKLAGTNLLSILTGDAAWDVLNESEQAVLYSMLPATPTNAALAALNPLPRPDDLSKRNTAFVTDIRKFQEDLEAGFYDPRWQEAAAEAMELRAAGAFDEWKEKETEAFWGQKMEKS